MASNPILEDRKKKRKTSLGESNGKVNVMNCPVEKSGRFERNVARTSFARDGKDTREVIEANKRMAVFANRKQLQEVL